MWPTITFVLDRCGLSEKMIAKFITQAQRVFRGVLRAREAELRAQLAAFRRTSAFLKAELEA